MTERFSEDEVIAEIADLTRPRLVSFIEAELVIPLQTDGGQVFRQIDLARLELLCELSVQFDVAEDALCMILSLIDQLHGARSDLRSVLDAIAQEPTDIRARLQQRVRSAQVSTETN